MIKCYETWMLICVLIKRRSDMNLGILLNGTSLIATMGLCLMKWVRNGTFQEKNLILQQLMTILTIITRRNMIFESSIIQIWLTNRITWLKRLLLKVCSEDSFTQTLLSNSQLQISLTMCTVYNQTNSIIWPKELFHQEW